MRSLTCIVLTCSLALGLSAGASAGALLFEENFDYAAGDSLTWHGWICHSGCTTNRQQVVAPGLTRAGYPAAGIGNAAYLASYGQDTHVCFASQTSGCVYYAFLVNFSAANTAGDCYIHLGTNPWITAYYARVLCLRDASSNLAFGISKCTFAAPQYTGYDYSLNTTYLVVARYCFNSGSSTDDVVSLWVDPVLDCDAEPPPLLTVTSTTSDASALGAIALRQGTSAGAPAETIDGIRVGMTWTDVVCSLGSCCDGEGGCAVTEEPDCVAPSLWTAGETCAPNPCPQPAGSCCHPDGTCTVTGEAGCSETWTMFGVCEPNPCQADGVEEDGAEEAGAGGDLRVRIAPNPFTDSVSLQVVGANGSSARILIFDAAGRLVRTAGCGVRHGHVCMVDWDGRDDAGRALPAGIYLVRLACGSDEWVHRLIKAR